MADGAKNVGQVAGIWIGNVAPENTNIIWFDTNTSERRHKVYDFVSAIFIEFSRVSVF